MKLVVWLGNPWQPYQNTRHNVWAIMLENFLAREQLGALKYDAKFAAKVFKSEETIFAIPQTFMNLSGTAVEPLARFYKIAPEDILVLHDEIDFLTGKIALKNWWGTAGHNGLKSISEKLWSGDYQRIRIWIGRPEEGKISVADYVLQKFKPHEWEVLETKEEEIFESIRKFLL